MKYIAVLVTLGACAPLACSSSGAIPAPAADGGGEVEPVGDNLGTLPDVPGQAGIVYAAHFLSSELRAYRIDGDEPVALPTLELGNSTHDMVLDAVSDQLIVVSDIAKTASIYQLTRPKSAAEPAELPELLATIDVPERPVFALTSPYAKRLYVVASPPVAAGELLTEMLLYGYDLRDPTQPVLLEGAPYTIPATTSIALDPVRHVLFLVELTTDRLHGFDLGAGGFRPLPGEPLDLAKLYPQESSSAFSARMLTADPWRNRLYAARSQGVLSELLVIDYPADIPRGGALYSRFAGLGDLVQRADPFDVELDHDSRPNLLDAYVPAIDLLTGAVFLSADAWNGTASTAITVAISETMELAAGCEAFEGFGCWHRSHSGGVPGGHMRTDGTLCVDYTRGVVASTSLDGAEQDEPGRLNLFRYDESLVMSPWLTEAGGELLTDAYPIDVECF